MGEDASLDYRRALGCFATGVTVMTALGAGGPVGVTVNSFTSVSLAPRLILWCLDLGSERLRAFEAAERFGVNVLEAGQAALSARYAEPGGGILGPHALGPGGAPWLEGALARLDCRTRERLTLGDHRVLVGEVEYYDHRMGAGLTYFRGAYGRTGG